MPVVDRPEIWKSYEVHTHVKGTEVHNPDISMAKMIRMS
jgi:hypothetical protein